MLIYALSHRLVRHPISHTSTTADTAPQPRQRPPEPDTALMALDAAQSSVSSSSTLWAQASKEWVIPAKPKPGRKPKKELAPPQETQEIDSKGRRVQNRAAQRAFRERKQSQLAELQARVQSFEQGEIERNVALQQVSKRLKDENEQLKRENSALKEELARLKVNGNSSASTSTSAQGENVESVNMLKRWRDDSISSLLSIDSDLAREAMSRKRLRADTDSPVPSLTPGVQGSQTIVYMHSPPSLASSPGVSGSPFSPLPYIHNHAGTAPPSRAQSTFLTAPQPQRLVPKSFDAQAAAPPFDVFDCGLCTDNTPCVCREIAMQQAGLMPGMNTPMVPDYPPSGSHDQTVFKIEEAEHSPTDPSSSIIDIPPAEEDDVFIGATTRNSLSISPKPHALHNVPAYQPIVNQRQEPAPTQQTDANVLFQIRLPSPEPTPTLPPPSRSVPLPSRGARRAPAVKVWQTTPMDAPMCSGDPSNCPACKDDDFGKAFCTALGDTASAASQPCSSCPDPVACGKVPHTVLSVGSSATSGPPTVGSGLRTIELSPANSEEHRASDSVSGSTNPWSQPPAPLTAIPESVGSTGETASSTTTLETGSAANNTGTMPANEAWARLKSHPNIAFANLSMLAEVVARRTKCTGPLTVIHPAPGSITPERDSARSPTAPENARSHENNDAPILLTDPHAHFKRQEEQRAQGVMSPVADAQSAVGESSSFQPGTTPASAGISARRPSLVPQDELRECGRRRIREVDAGGVHEALRILDAQFGKHA